MLPVCAVSVVWKKYIESKHLKKTASTIYVFQHSGLIYPTMLSCLWTFKCVGRSFWCLCRSYNFKICYLRIRSVHIIIKFVLKKIIYSPCERVEIRFTIMLNAFFKLFKVQNKQWMWSFYVTFFCFKLIWLRIWWKVKEKNTFLCERFVS